MIVGSILLAFGLQAWWDESRERVEEQEYFVALLDDIDAVISEANRTVALNDSTTERSRQRIAAVEALRAAPDSIPTQIIFRLRANLDTYDDIISSGSVTQLRDPNVRHLLAILRAEMDFERLAFEQAVARFGMDGSTLMGAHGAGAPNLWSMSVQAEKLGNMWRDIHVARKRDVIRTAKDAREAILAAIKGA